MVPPARAPSVAHVAAASTGVTRAPFGPFPTAMDALQTRAAAHEAQLDAAERAALQPVGQALAKLRANPSHFFVEGTDRREPRSLQFSYLLPKGSSNRFARAAASQMELSLAREGFRPYFDPTRSTPESRVANFTRERVGIHFRPFDAKRPDIELFVHASSAPPPYELPSVAALFDKSDALEAALSQPERAQLSQLLSEFPRRLSDNIQRQLAGETDWDARMVKSEAAGELKEWSFVTEPRYDTEFTTDLRAKGISESVTKAAAARLEAELRQRGYSGHEATSQYGRHNPTLAQVVDGWEDGRVIARPVHTYFHG